MKRQIVPSLVLILVAAVPIAAGQLAPGDDAGGGLRALLPGGVVREMPLRHTDVRVEISGFVARTVVEQTFVNPLDAPVEAVYTFPLGDDAAVDDFELRSGDRIVGGTILRRDEARDAYVSARRDGLQAALLEQARPNAFVQSIANLMPGADVRIRLRTVELLDYDGGTYEYLFPMVVGPRYAAPDELAGSIAYGMPPSDLDEPSGAAGRNGITLRVELAAGVPIRSLECPTGTIYVTHRSPTDAEIELAEVDRRMDDDFVLRWDVSAPDPEIGLLTHRDGGAGVVALLVQPPGSVGPLRAAPKEVILVLDTSGSMSGEPLETSVAFARAALESLGPRDRFNIVRFDTEDARFSRGSLPNEPQSIRRALQWLDGLEADGGTEMLRGLRRAVEDDAADGEFRQIVFLTDGRIGDEREILDAIDRLPDAYRVFTVGIGNNVNHYLLDRMARHGDGATTSIPSGADGHRALDRFRRWVTRPYLTDLEVDWGTLPVTEVAPRRPRDLFSGQNLYLVGRYDRPATGAVTLRGWVGGEYWERTVPVTLPSHATANAGLASAWARHRIEELLSDESELAEDVVRERVTELALRHRLMSPYTSFVAVDRSAVVNPDGVCRRVVQSVAPPDAADLPAAVPEYGVTERVQVTAGAPLVDLSSNANSTTYTDRFAQDLPVPGRFRQAVLTTAAPSRDFAAVVAGVESISPPGAPATRSIEAGSIDELTLITSGAGVEFSRGQGGFARIIQKQGSNDFEGDVEASIVDELGSRSAALTVSGPIVEDRLWFRTSHGTDDLRDAIDTTRELVVAPTRSVRHDGRLTWQAAPRTKLGFSFRTSWRAEERFDADSRRGADSSRARDSESEAWALSWVSPVSPRLLVESSLARQRLDHGEGPAGAEGPAGCIAGAGELDTAYCDDWAGGRISGAWFVDVEDRRVRDTLRSEVQAFAGRLFGATHTVRAGIELTRDDVRRHEDRGPSVIRLSDPQDGRSLVVARVAAEPAATVTTSGRGASIWIEDRMVPIASLNVTLGVRLDTVRLDASRRETTGASSDRVRLRDESLSPFVAVSWDPWRDGDGKVFATLRRYHDDLHPSLPFAELRQATRDVVPGVGDGPRNVVDLDRGLRAPRQDEWTLGFERRIAVETRLSVTAIGRHHSDQLGFVDLNHPYAAEPGEWLTRDPGLGEVLLVDNRVEARVRSYVLEIVRRRFRGWELEGSYTWSSMRGTADRFDPRPGDEPSRWQQAPGNDASTRRHVFTLRASTVTPWGVRLEGALLWQSGFPYTAYESGLLLPTRADGTPVGVPVPRLFVADAARNSRWNGSTVTLDVRVSHERHLGRRVSLVLYADGLDLLDGREAVVRDAAAGRGAIVDGTPQGVRSDGRRFRLGAILRF